MATGSATFGTFRRAVDLYVDGELIAWFFEGMGPARDTPLTFEEVCACVCMTSQAGGEGGVDSLSLLSLSSCPSLLSRLCLLCLGRLAVDSRISQGRSGVWLEPHELDMCLAEDEMRRADEQPPKLLPGVPPLSSWHACVLKAWRRGERRADFYSAP